MRLDDPRERRASEMTDTPSAPSELRSAIPAALRPASRLSEAEIRQVVAREGLEPLSTRLPLRAYVNDVWRRRWFVWELARGNAYARNQDNRLGQLWAVLNPLLTVGAYYLIFGLLLDTRRGVENYVGFLSVGVFTFSFISGTLTVGSRSLLRSQGMMRALRFPRAALPIAAVLTEMLLLLPAIGVLLVILLITGEPLSPSWLLLPVALVLLHLFCTGTAMLAARIVSRSRDLDNLIPVIMRIARYVSGVFFSVSAYAGHGAIGLVMQYQPLALFIDIVRSSMMAEVPVNPVHWYVAAAWSAVAMVAGGLLLWRGEGTYGRG